MAKLTRCDGCRIESMETPGWIRLQIMMADPMRAFMSGQPTARVSADLCSWKCAADYASLQALDPAPPSTELT